MRGETERESLVWFIGDIISDADIHTQLGLTGSKC